MRVIVVGGGVAGTVSAIALRRIGAEVEIVEAYPDPAGSVGSWISLSANGQRALAAAGCLERVRARGFPVPRQRLWTGDGKLLGDVARGRRAEDELFSVTMMRADLVGELRAAAREAGARVTTGDRLVALDGTTARFAGGRVAEADLVVGADGIWSTVRAALDAGAPRAEYAGQYVVSGVTPGGAGAEPVFNMIFGRNGTFIHLPAPDGTVWWQAQVTSPAEPGRDGFDPEVWRARLGRYHLGEPQAAAIIAAATEIRPPTVNHMLGPVKVWRGRGSVLIGDASHPVGAGQGASMAMEDGIELAAAIGRATAGAERIDAERIDADLAAFEGRRRPRIGKMLKASDDNRAAKLAGPVRRRMERVVMPIVLRHFYERATGWLYDYEPAA